MPLGSPIALPSLTSAFDAFGSPTYASGITGLVAAPEAPDGGGPVALTTDVTAFILKGGSTSTTPPSLSAIPLYFI